MPGGRLTYEDRERIAAWLSEGLGYAEIARRLSRPTSTVSREVARNGGVGQYRAERAQQATGVRARRQRPPRLPKRPAEFDAHGRDPDAVSAFVEQFASLMVETGLPRMAARVFACLFTSDSASLSARDMVQRLRVSPASVSKAIGYLEGLDVVRRERDQQQRRERYIIEDDVWYGSWLSSAKKVARWAEIARHGSEVMNTTTPAGARLEQMGRFFARLGDDMSGGPSTMGASDAVTVLAALVHAGVPLTADQLADALHWPVSRIDQAVAEAETYPDLGGPVAIRRTTERGYAVTTNTARLSDEQRAGLRRVAGTTLAR